MLLRSDLPAAATIRQVGQVDAVPRADGVADPRQEAFQRSMTNMLGKSMLAQVLARMGDGSFLVKVEGTPVRMLLPKGAQVGSDVPLTLVSAQPRPTFQISGGDGRPLPAAAYIPGAPLTSLDDSALAYDAKGAALPATARQDAADPGAARFHPAQLGAGALGKAAPLAPATALQHGAAALDAAAAPAPVLSDTARVISSVLGAAQQAPGAKTAALSGTEPLVTAPKPDPAQLAHKLSQAISQSGLFYESHLAEWAAGTRSMSELMHEPQATRAPVPPTDPNTAQFINLQLTSQEQARVLWQGQLLPGQQMQWEIEKDAPEGGQAGEQAPEPAWRSGMRFRLPRLGEIDATVVMVGNQVQIEIQTTSSAIGAMLRQHAGGLTAAMEAAGTPLTSLTIGVPPDEHGDV